MGITHTLASSRVHLDLRPIVPIEAAILHGLSDVLGADRWRPAEIGNRTCDLENAVVGTGGESHTTHRHFERALAGVIECAELANVARGHACVGKAAGLLHGTGAFDTGTDVGGGFGV